MRMNYQPRRILPPSASRKQKEKEPSSYGSMWPLSNPAGHKPKQAESAASSNRLLAGYMAYEFLTKGTVLGQVFDPVRAEAAQVHSSSSDEARRGRPGTEVESGEKLKSRTYDEVASLLKSDGAHIPGVVNPTQLARWLQM